MLKLLRRLTMFLPIFLDTQLLLGEKEMKQQGRLLSNITRKRLNYEILKRLTFCRVFILKKKKTCTTHKSVDR